MPRDENISQDECQFVYKTKWDRSRELSAYSTVRR